MIKKYRFDRERIVEVFSVEIFLRFFNIHTCVTFIVELRSSCSSYHLKNIRNRHIHVGLQSKMLKKLKRLLWVEEFSSFDNNQLSWEVDSPSKGTCCYKYLYFVLYKQLLYYASITCNKSCMMHSDSKGKCLF